MKGMVTMPPTLTPEQIKKAHFQAIKEYLNNFHDIEEIEDAPYPIQLAVDKMIIYGKRDGTIRTETISDLSRTYQDVQGLPNDVLSLISPWSKVRW